MVRDIRQQTADGIPAGFILRQGVEQGGGEPGTEGNDEEVQVGTDGQLGIGSALLGKPEDLAGVEPDLAVIGTLPGVSSERQEGKS